MWANIVTALLGIWLMIAPHLLGVDKRIANNAHIVGPLIVAFSIIAIWECTRNARLFNLPLALWLMAAPLVLQYNNDNALMNDYTIAIIIILSLLVKRQRHHRFGGGWPSLWSK
jgi:hypothetical protein